MLRYSDIIFQLKSETGLDEERDCHYVRGSTVNYKPGESTYDNDIYHRAQLVADGDP